MVDIIGRARVIVESQVDKSSLDQSGSRIGSGLKAGALVGVAALGTLAAAGVKSVLAFEEAESVGRKLTQVLDNMGKSGAGPAVDDLSSKLQRLTGVDDEVIKGGETILATFSQVADSAGVMGGTFERATNLAVDLAAAGFGDVSSSAVQLGKALQDPVHGVVGLTRVGITFTETQKEQIKNFVKTGDVAAAQNLILKEVEKQVGGTAEASAKGSDKIARGFDEIEEASGQLIVTLAGKKKGQGLADLLFNIAAAEDTLNTKLEHAPVTLKLIRGTFIEMGHVFKNVGKDALYLLTIIDHLIDAIQTLRGAKPLIGGDHAHQPKPSTEDVYKDVFGFASGGRNIPAGWSWVGEQGPERIYVPQGSDIYSNQESTQMAGNTFNIYTTGAAGPDLVQELNWWGKFGALTAVGNG